MRTPTTPPLASVVDLRSPTGAMLGYVYAAQRIDPSFLGALASATHVGVTVVGTDGLSSEDGVAAKRDIKAVTKVAANRTVEAGGRYVRRIDPDAGQPLTFAISVPKTTGHGLFAIVAAVILFAALGSGRRGVGTRARGDPSAARDRRGRRPRRRR